MTSFPSFDHVVDPLKVAAAKAEWEGYMDMDWFRERPLAVQELYRRFPPYKFYGFASGGGILRVYGIREFEKDVYRLAVVSAHFSFNNDVMGGMSPEDVVEIPCYDSTMLMFRQNNPALSIMLDPNGWKRFITE